MTCFIGAILVRTARWIVPGEESTDLPSGTACLNPRECSASIFTLGLIAEVSVFDRKIGNRFGHRRNTRLQLITLCAGNPYGIPLNRRLHLQLRVLDQLDDLLCKLGLDTDLDLQFLLDLVAGDLLDGLVIQTLHTLLLLLLHGGEENVLYLAELEI